MFDGKSEQGEVGVEALARTLPAVLIGIAPGVLLLRWAVRAWGGHLSWWAAAGVVAVAWAAAGLSEAAGGKTGGFAGFSLWLLLVGGPVGGVVILVGRMRRRR